jgi:hypothetical protein
LKNYIYVPSKSNKEKKFEEKILLLLMSLLSLTKIAGSGSISQRYESEDSDSDPYQILWICNTVANNRPCTAAKFGESQRGHKEMSSWLTNSALVYKPNTRGRGGGAGSQPVITAVHMEPK